MILLNIWSSALRDLERMFLRQVKSSAPLLDDAATLPSSDDSLFQMIIKRFPESYETTLKIVAFLSKTRGYQVSKDEQTYITIHLARIVQKNV